MTTSRSKKFDPLDYLNKNNQIMKSRDSAILLAVEFEIKLNCDRYKVFPLKSIPRVNVI